MILEEGVVVRLMATAPLTALIGARLYPQTIPEEAPRPAAAFQRISGTYDTAHDGPTGWGRARLQFTAQADIYLEAKAVAAAIRAALHGFRGTMGTVTVHGAFATNDLDGFNEATDRETVRLDVLFYYKES